MRTKIIATVGPSCADAATLRAMVKAGAGVFRFNFSHGTFEEHERTLQRIRAIQRQLGRHIGILQDLAGYRIRTGHLQRGRPVALAAGQRFALYRSLAPGSRRGVSLDYPGAFNRIRPGQMIYVADGNLHLKVIRSSADRLDTLVVQEGALGERKGVNIPGAPLDFPPISTKDIHDLDFATRNRIDYVAQSFVRNAGDVAAVKRRLQMILPQCKIVAKIESREGIQQIAEILRAADGIMVARGDLGISVPIYEIPLLQKWMIAACNHFKKPVVTATQMLEQMIDHRQPTRAEVSDVANAVIDGSDFVMLSGETATGRFPVESVAMMRTIIEHTERYVPYRGVRRTR